MQHQCTKHFRFQNLHPHYLKLKHFQAKHFQPGYNSAICSVSSKKHFKEQLIDLGNDTFCLLGSWHFNSFYMDWSSLHAVNRQQLKYRESTMVCKEPLAGARTWPLARAKHGWSLYISWLHRLYSYIFIFLPVGAGTLLYFIQWNWHCLVLVRWKKRSI